MRPSRVPPQGAFGVTAEAPPLPAFVATIEPFGCLASCGRHGPSPKVPLWLLRLLQFGLRCYSEIRGFSRGTIESALAPQQEGPHQIVRSTRRMKTRSPTTTLEMSLASKGRKARYMINLLLILLTINCRVRYGNLSMCIETSFSCPLYHQNLYR